MRALIQTTNAATLLCALLWCAHGRADSGCAVSGPFSLNNNLPQGGSLVVDQRAQGTFLAGVPFMNTFRVRVIGSTAGIPTTVVFSLNGQSVTVPYVSGEAQTSAFDLGALPAGTCAMTSTLSVVARASNGSAVAQTYVPLRAITIPNYVPPAFLLRVRSLSPLQWGQEIVYESWPQFSFMNLDATWHGTNVLFQDYGGLFSGGKLSFEFNGAKGECTYQLGLDLSMRPNPIGKLLKPVTHKKLISFNGEGTLVYGASATAHIDPATGCFEGGPIVCGNGAFGYEWKMVPIGPLFGVPGLWFTGTAALDFGPALCVDVVDLVLNNPGGGFPLTSGDISLNLLGQGGLELGIPYFLSLFGGMEGSGSGLIHVFGDPIPTCYDWPLLADLDFDLSIVGYARLGFKEWQFGRYVIVQWTCPTTGKRHFSPVLLNADAPTMRAARRPYLENGEVYAAFEPPMRARTGKTLRPSTTTGEVEELVTSNANLEATPAIAGWGNMTLLATSEDDPATLAYAEHEIQAVFRDGATWGNKQAITNNSDSDIQPSAAFDVAGKAIIAWTTVPGTTGTENLPLLKAKMEIAYAVHDTAANAWNSPVHVTTDGTMLDALPQVVRGGDGSTSLVWLRSPDNTMAVAPDEPLGNPSIVMISRWNGSAFQPEQVLLSGCDAAGPIRYARDAAGGEYLLWTRDVDGISITMNDREVVESHTVGGVWTTAATLTANSANDTAVGLVASNAGVIAYGVRAGSGGSSSAPQDELMAWNYDGNDWSAELAMFEAPSILSPAFAVGSIGTVSCTWVGSAINASGKAVFYATSPTGIGGWSTPQEMATSLLPTAPACAYVGANLQVGYVTARAAARAPARTPGLAAGDAAFDVQLLEHTPFTDLFVRNADVTVSPQPPVGDQPATVSITVHLSGDFAQAGAAVAVYDGDPSAGGTPIGIGACDLVPGGSCTTDLAWTYPSDVGQHTLWVVIDPDGQVAELDETNNIAWVPMGAINLVATAVHTTFSNPNELGIEASFENESYAQLNNVGYELRRDSELGPVIASGNVPTVQPGEAVTTVVPWDVSLTPPGRYDLFFIVDSLGTITETEEIEDNVVSGNVAVLGDLQAEPGSARLEGGNALVVVRNVGAKPMGPSVVRILANQQILGESPVQALAAGESVDVSLVLNVTAPAGWLELVVNPDSDGSDEVTLLNNSASVAVTISDPPSGTVDAREPHALDAATPAQGIDQVDIAFNNFMASLTIADFMVTQVGGDATPPALVGALPLTVDSVRLTLATPIDPQAWTVFEHLGSSARTCVGFLPGDVDANQISDTQDAGALVQSLNGLTARAIYSTDMDRSGVLTAEDLVQLLNVLNGAGAFDPWLGVALPASPCP